MIRNAPPRGGAASARAGAAGVGGDPLGGESSSPAGAQQVQVQLGDDTDYSVQQQREREMRGLEVRETLESSLRDVLFYYTSVL